MAKDDSLTILIPARNELFLSKTIDDILTNMRGNTEIIAVCDGNWPDPPIEDHQKVTLIYHSESIGQRAATNEAAKLARSKYVMKCDAHCSFAEGFDVVLMEDMQDDWTMVPVMRNLHAFDWVCEEGHRRYQSPSGVCTICGKETKRDVVWIAKHNPQSTAYLFDSEPHFQYFKEYKDRKEYKEALKNKKLTETMSLQGSCWMLTRDRYFELDVSNEDFGSWGSQGIEVAAKTHLSGGRVIINHRTYYAHMFRTQGGDFGFPYSISGRQVQRAKRKAKDIFFNNKWPLQKYPLSWLIEKFWPIPGWTNEDYESLKEGELNVERSGVYSVVNHVENKIYIESCPNIADSFNTCRNDLQNGTHSNKQLQNAWNKYGQNSFSFSIECFCSKDETLLMKERYVEEYQNNLGAENIYNECLSLTDCYKDEKQVYLPKLVNKECPRSLLVNDRESLNNTSSKIFDVEVKPRNAIVYYTDNRGDENILNACRKQIIKATRGEFEIISVSLKPLDFGKNIVLDLERSVFTMFKQILAGVENASADIVWFAEHDVLYHPSHYDFYPEKHDVFYYDENRWFVDYESGRALFYHACSTSMLVAHRKLLIEHYRTRVKRVEQEGFTLRLGYEPGNHPFPRGVDMYRRETFFAKSPSIDIRHKGNLTPSRWSKDQFRNKRNLHSWTESDTVPSWGVTKGSFKKILEEINQNALS